MRSTINVGNCKADPSGLFENHDIHFFSGCSSQIVGNMKIVVIGNSVGLRVRPPRSERMAGNFGEVLERLLQKERGGQIYVYNRCRSFHTVSDLYRNDFEAVVGLSPDAVIIIVGINEAVSRPLPRRIYGFLNKPRPFRSSAHPISKVNNGFNRMVFPRFMKLLKLKGWDSPESYIKQLRIFIELLYKETRSPVFVMNILPCTKRIEKILPGSQRTIAAFNIEILELCLSMPYIHLVDVAGLVPEEQIDSVVPDGIHMSADLHVKVACSLEKLICASVPLR